MSQTGPPGGSKAICGFSYVDPARNKHVYLAQLSLSAHCRIGAYTSRTVLTQTFTNSLEKTIPELRYTFPIYDGVSVVGFTCAINNDRVIRGVVKEKSDARDTFEKARDRGETAGLLENLPEATEVFTTSVANVPSGAKLKIEIVYIGELKHDAQVDGIRFTIPTFVAPKYGEYPGELLGENVLSSDGIEIVVDAEMPTGSIIQTMSSPSHPISVTLGSTSREETTGADPSLQRASATLSLGKTELDRDFVLQVVATKIGDPLAVLEKHPDIPGQHAILATLVPRFSLPSLRPEIVFICDRSASMNASIPNLKEALHVFLKSLPVGVKFNICSFGSNHELLFASGSETYNATSLAKATKYVNGFAANFVGTKMYEPMKEIMERRDKDVPLQIILLTDGQIWDQEKLFTLVEQQVRDSNGGIRVFTLGIGNYVSHSLIEGVAKAGNGFSQVVGETERMNTKVIRMLKACLQPLVRDYTLEVKYGPGNSAQNHENSEVEELGFEIVEKATDGQALDASGSELSITPSASDPASQRQSISLLNTCTNLDVRRMGNAPTYNTAGGKYASVPPVSTPKFLQIPFNIPPLYPFNRTSIYLLMSPEADQRSPKSVVLRGTSEHGPLELEIPVSTVKSAHRDATIHQLAARAAIRDMEANRGWIHQARDATGLLHKDTPPGSFPEMVEREAVRLGTTYQVANRWCSFVAVEERDNGQEKAERSAEVLVAPAPTPVLTRPHGGGTDRYRRLSPEQMRLLAYYMGQTGGETTATGDQQPSNPSGMKTSGVARDNKEVSDGSENKSIGPTSSVGNGFDAIVAQQTFRGSWPWRRPLFTALGIGPAALLHAAGEVLGRSGLDKPSDALATAVVLAFLESKLSERREEWDMLANKAEVWLDENIPGGKMPRKDYVEAVRRVLTKSFEDTPNGGLDTAWTFSSLSSFFQGFWEGRK